jgi:hypothetical protein
LIDRASEAEKVQRDELTHEEWGAGLSLPEYLAREQRLRAHPWSKGMATWLLRGERGEVLSSCETFRMDSALGERGSTYAVASVFTEKRLRGKGHAARLMSLLASEDGAVQRSDSSAQSVILFSDVGPSLYQRSGFQLLPAFEWRFDASPAASDVDQRFSEGELASALSFVRRSADPFSISPSAEQVDWHLERERIYSHALHRARPSSCGARAGNSVALWTASYKSNELLILLLSGVDEREAFALVAEARRQAHEAKLNRVVFWDSGEPWRFEHAQGVRSERNSSLPMIRPLRPQLRDLLAQGRRIAVPRALWV